MAWWKSHGPHRSQRERQQRVRDERSDAERARRDEARRRERSRFQRALSTDGWDRPPATEEEVLARAARIRERRSDDEWSALRGA